MNPQPRSGMGFSSQQWMLVIAITLLPAVAIVGLSAWEMSAMGVASTTPFTLWGATLIVAMLTILIVAFGALRIRGLVRSRLADMAEACRQLAAGNREMRLQVDDDDEFGTLSAAVNTLLERAATPLAHPESPEAAMLQQQIEKLLQEVSAVSDGDLRVQAEVTPDTLGVLADSFNYMIEELAKVVGQVQRTTLQVTSGTRRLLDRAADVAQSSEVQQMQISQTSDAVARLAEFVQLSADNALQAQEVAREALRNAEAGRQAVVQTIDGMVRIRENVQETRNKIKRLGERSQEVSEILPLIEDIADQTNLLALNAAIQSTIAGEQGRITMVAQEIPALAARVTEATRKIETIVKSIQGDTLQTVVAMEETNNEVVTGSRLADEAGRALQSIYGAVERQAQMIAGIAQAAGERKQTAEAVALTMGAIAETTRQTNAATQDTTTSISYLADLAEQLRAKVATFRLPDAIAEQAGLPNATAQILGGTGLPSLGGGSLPALGGPQQWGASARDLPALPPASVPAFGGPGNTAYGMGQPNPYAPGQGYGYGAGASGYPGAGAPMPGYPVSGYPPTGHSGTYPGPNAPSAYPGGYPGDGASVGAVDPFTGRPLGDTSA